MSAPALWWKKHLIQGVRTNDELLRLVAKSMAQLKLTNIGIEKDDVHGFTATTTVAVTFVRLDENHCLAIVVAAGNDAFDLQNSLMDKIAHWTFP